LELDPRALSHETSAKLLLGLVVPRPIAVVSTVSVDGHLNIAPFSYYNVVSDMPMALSFSITGPKADRTIKDTLRNVRPAAEGGMGEFVINAATEHYAPAIARAGVSLPYGSSEFDYAQLTPAPSRTVKAPRIAEARASFECRTLRIVPVGEAHLVIGEVTHLWLQDGLADERMRVDPNRLEPIGRLAGTTYCRVIDLFEMTAEVAPTLPQRVRRGG
jgi:flavin reductase (DIM6/NTAB) family NADH-FMN oxidoreductase RutF